MELSEFVLQGVSLEDRAERLMRVVDSADDLWAHELAVRVGSLAGLLETFSDPLTVKLAVHARLLERALALHGADGAGEVLLEWPQLQGNPVVQGLQDGLTLRSMSSEPRIRQLAAMLQRETETNIADYGIEVVQTALLEAASLGWVETDAGERKALADSLRDAVIAAPRARTDVARYYVVRSEDTLRNIAEAIIGNQDSWPEVIARYDLHPPYLYPEFRPGCLYPGVRLMLPPTPGVAEAGLGATLTVLTEADEWDLVVGQNGDLQITAGLEGFAMDLGLRAATPLGDLRDAPSYGMVEVAGLPASTQGLVTALLLSDTLREDPRVLEVVSAATARTRASSGVVADNIVILPRPELVGG